MRRIATHSARLASSQQSSRLIHPRIPHWQRVRNLTTTAPRFSARRPGDEPSESKSLEEQKEREREAVGQDLGGDGYGTEARRSGVLRRTMRRRATEVPKPPDLPDWFLKGNVELCEGADEVAVGVGEGGRDLKYVDVRTGEVGFRIRGCSVEKDEKGADEEGDGKAKEQEVREKEERDKKATIPGLHMLDENFFQQKFDGQIPPVLMADGSDSPLGFRIPSLREQDGFHHDPLTWTFLETEASARAAMQVSAHTGGVASHAASRSDIHLHCPDSNAHEQMDQYVRDLTIVLKADLIRLDANDFADLTDDYVGGSNDAPGSFSTLGYEVFDGASATGVGIRGSRPGNAPFENSSPENREEEEDEEDELPANQGINLGHFESMDDLRKTLYERRHELGKMLGGSGGIAGASIVMPGGGNPFMPAGNFGKTPEKKSERDYVQWDDARLTALLDHVLDAPKAKREGRSDVSAAVEDNESRHPSSMLRPQGDNSAPWPKRAATALADVFDKIGRWREASNTVTRLEADDSEPQECATESPRRTVVHVRDLKEINSSRLGEAVVRRLVRVAQKRRRAGEEIVVIGTTSQDVQGPLDGLLDANEDSPFRLTVVPPLFGMNQAERTTYEHSAPPIPTRAIAQPPSYGRITEINFRHIRSMLLRLGQGKVDVNAMEDSLKQLRVPGTMVLSERVLAQDQVQRLILTAIGLARSHAQGPTITPAHIGLATAVLSRADHSVHSWQGYRDHQRTRSSRSMGFGKSATEPGPDQSPGQARIESLKKNSNTHETRLMTGVVDPQNIKTGFADVHATPETIEALKSLTTLSLLRPDAFKYGVLANDRLTGLLLYGPPGTGKTLLAKAVAKESQATVLEVSGAQIYEKYVGEGEKMVRAVFSLARKLSPCVVFIDEADAIFGSRGGGSGSRNTHREIINQFLREWDGMDDNGVFMMVASNRPFDLDDAVLRRLPRRLLVDLPVAKDRESILGIHLRHESLDSSVRLGKLAEQTPLYSGSDLKNLCVSAALAAVREENELVAAKKDDKDFKLPERRTLTEKHFEKAVQEISASISEDMGSLTAIRRFDEQFGDRRGRKKKSGYGFGTGGEKVDEGAARVRGGP